MLHGHVFIMYELNYMYEFLLSRQDKRTAIRLKALDVLSLVLSINKHMYEVNMFNTSLNYKNLVFRPGPTQTSLYSHRR